MYKSSSYERRFDAVLVATIALACLGPGVYYYGFYPFHFVLPLAAWCILAKGRKQFYQTTKANKALFAFIGFNILFDLITITWADDKMAAVRYTVVEAIGFAVAVVIVSFVGSQREKFERVLRVLMIVGCVSLLIGLLEILTPFRWSFSKLSSFANEVGVATSAFDLKQLALYPEVLQTTPTGLNWNPNDFALMIGLVLPFASSRVSRALFAFIQIAVVTAISFASARLTLLAVSTVAAVNLVARRSSTWLVSITVIVLFVLVSALELPKQYRQLNELTPFGFDYKDAAPVSVSYRKILMNYALQLFREQPIGGIGAGNFQPKASMHFGESLPVSDLHFYWLQYVVEKGLVGLVATLTFVVLVIRRFTRIYANGNAIQRRTIVEFAASGVILILGGISLSSMVYFLPMYVWLGLAIAFTNMCDAIEENPAAS